MIERLRLAGSGRRPRPHAGDRSGGSQAAGGRWRARASIASLTAMFAGAAALTLMMAAPLLPAPGQRLFGAEIVGRHPDAYRMVGRFEQPRFDAYTQALTDVPGAALAALTGSGVVAYNLVVLASFPLAALTAFAMVRVIGGSWFAASVAGLLYAFAPYHLAHGAYHPHVAQVQWLPLVVLAVWRCLEAPGTASAVALAGAVLATAMSCFYYGLVAAVLVPALGFGAWLAWRGRGTPAAARGLLPLAGGFCLAAAATLLYVPLAAPRIVAEPTAAAFPLAEVARYGARWWSYLLPAVDHPILGPFARARWGREEIGDALVEQQLGLGLGAVILAAIAVAAALRRPREPRLAAVPLLLTLAAASLLVSLAPVAGGGLPPPLSPAAWLHAVLPMFRAYARFGVGVLLAVAALAGLGAAELVGRRSRVAPALGIGLLALAAFETAPFPPWRWHHVLPTGAHRWLAAQPSPVRALDCVSAAHPGEATLPALFPHTIRLRGPRDDCGQPGLAGWLAAHGTTHLIVRSTDPLAGWLGDRDAPRGLERIGSFADALLFRVALAPPEVYLEFGDGFSWRELHPAGSYRWMGRGGSVVVVNRDGAARRGTLRLVLSGMPDGREIILRWPGEAPRIVRTAAGPAPYLVGPLNLPRGRSRLELAPLAPPIVADELLHNGDQRQLSVAVWDWEWRELEPVGFGDR